MSKLNIYTKLISNKLIRYIEIILPLFIVLNYNIYPFSLVFTRVFVLCIILILIVIKYPLTKSKNNNSLLKYADNILIISIILIAVYSYFELDKFIQTINN